MSPVHRLTAVAALALTAALLLPLASATAFSTGGYVVKTKLFGPGLALVGKLGCPSGKSLVSGGAGWVSAAGTITTDVVTNTWLTASLPLNSHTWVASGYNTTDNKYKLKVTIACLPTSAVGTYATNGIVLSEDSAGRVGSYVACPGGDQIVTGGAGWRLIGDPFVPSMTVHHRLGSTSPTIQANGWYADGLDDAAANDAAFQISVLCLPAAKVGTYKTRYATTNTGPLAVSKSVSCPAGWRVVAQGAYWHRANAGPDASEVGEYTLTAAISNAKMSTATGAGFDYPTTLLLTTVIHCRKT